MPTAIKGNVARRGAAAVCAAAFAAAALVSPSAADGPGLVDYSAGDYADRLCDGGAYAFIMCRVTRTVDAAKQGAQRRALAIEAGGSCEWQSGLPVCFDVDSVLVQRGGTTYGDTFLSPDPPRDLDPALIAHEREHVRQWRLFGADFAMLYLLEGTDACGNYFEVQAGLDAGGYSCD